MITVLPSNNSEEIKQIFKENNLVFNENAGCVTAMCGEEKLGYCLYYLDSESITVLSLKPADDLMLADGILRSALHVAAEHFVMKAFYAPSATEELFSKLEFIKNNEEKTLDIDKLFGGCGCKNGKS